MEFGAIHVRDIEASDNADIVDIFFDKCWAVANRKAVTQARVWGRKIVNMLTEDMFVKYVEKEIPPWDKGWWRPGRCGKLFSGLGRMGRVRFR